MKHRQSLLFLIALLVLPLVGYCQSDSTRANHNDSLQDQNLAQGELLLSRSDSLHRADSLAQSLLLEQIRQVQANDARKKEELQKRLDSLKKSQELAKLRIEAQVDSMRSSTPGVPVILFEDTIFRIYARIGPFGPSERATNLAGKIEALVDQKSFDQELLILNRNEESYDLMHGEVILFSLSHRDAAWYNDNAETVCEELRQAILKSVEAYQEENSLWTNLIRAGELIIVLVLFFLFLRYLNRGFFRLNQWLKKKLQPYLTGHSIKNYEVLSKEHEEQLLTWAFRSLRWITLIIVAYLFLPAVFSIFPATQSIANTLIGYIIDPLKSFFGGLIAYIPELITIIVIVFIARYFIRFLAFLSEEITTGKLEIPGFYPDWAAPTLNLLKIIVYAFTFVVIFPYLPGSGSPVFQGVSVFFGLLISLGSSSAIGNIIAGLVITYMRAFKIGDRVKIGETSGEVLEKTMLVTRIRTIKNEDVTIPNSAILNGSTINYSSSAHSKGLILNTSITIGYDVPWRKVHELLIGAAEKCEAIHQEPKPFVLQTALEDFYVNYQINAYTHQAEKAALIYSELHANIQDAFNEAGIEILSPHYRAARDGNMVTIPAQYLDPDYKAPSFKVNIDPDKDQK